jgi:hypothetical protein
MATEKSNTATLEERVHALEDRLEIYQLMMSHPPAVDGGATDFWARVWTDNAEFDRGLADPDAHSGNYEGSYGVETIIQEMSGPELQAAREAGLAHMTTVPYLTLNGDKAIATNYTLVFGYEKQGFRIRRLVANRWDLERHAEGWKIKRRALRLLDGNKEARDILRQGVEASVA